MTLASFTNNWGPSWIIILDRSLKIKWFCLRYNLPKIWKRTAFPLRTMLWMKNFCGRIAACLMLPPMNMNMCRAGSKGNYIAAWNAWNDACISIYINSPYPSSIYLDSHVCGCLGFDSMRSVYDKLSALVVKSLDLTLTKTGWHIYFKLIKKPFQSVIFFYPDTWVFPPTFIKYR